MRARKESTGLVYSTRGGRMCADCRQPIGECGCGRGKSAPAGSGVVRVSREIKGRNGRTVTVVRGLPLDTSALALLGRELRALCGSGGTARDGVVEVQGDHCDRVIELLASRFGNVKRAGG